MVCPYCGSATSGTAGACASCGRALPHSASTAVTTLTPPSDGTQPPFTTTPTRTEGPLAIGQQFGSRYRILKVLGAGGMGVVYQAWDGSLDLPVALKVIRPEVLADATVAREVEGRFRRELVLARQVTHRNVVRIHDLGEIDGIKYISMPFIEGKSLAAIMAESGRLPCANALPIVRQIAEGLRAAHEAGVIHRDLKPENVMVDTDGHAVIMDFGISRSASASTTIGLTAAGSVIGTVQYMAPEQAMGEPVDQRVDVYALGLIAYDLMAGSQRFVNVSTPVSEMMHRVQHAPAPLRTRVPDAPREVERIIGRALEPDPAKRYQKVGELIADLDAFASGGNRGRPGAPTHSLTAVIAAVAVIVVAALGGASWWFLRGRLPAAAIAHETISVLVSDFDNRAKDPLFDGALEQTLGIGIEGASFISAYPRSSAQKAVQKLAPGHRLDVEQARLLARREGIKVVLAGAIEPAGNGYTISVRAIDPVAGTDVARVSRTAPSKGEVLQAMSNLVGDLRTRLGDTTVDVSRKAAAAETFTAGSLEAMRSYARCQDLFTQGNYQDAIKECGVALQHDPELGRAYAVLGTIYANQKQMDRAKVAYGEAMKRLDRMSERERYRTLATYYITVAGNPEQAIESYETLLKLYPADNSAYGNLALAYLYAGNVPKALEVARKGLEIYPRNLLQRTNYAAYCVYGGEFETAGREAERVLSENPKYEYAYLPLALSQAGRGDLASARATYGRLAALGDAGRSLASAGEVDLLMYSGQYDAAAQALRGALALDEHLQNTGELAIKHVMLAEAALADGDKGRAIAEARIATSKSTALNVSVPAARVLIDAGQDDAVRELAGSLERGLQTRTISYGRLLLGDLAFRRGRLVEATELLRDAQKRHDSWLSRFVLARLYQDAGHDAEAVEEFERCYRRRGEVTDIFFSDSPSVRYLPQMYYWLGRARDAVGAAESARAAYSEYVKARGEAPRDPLIADARRRLGS